VVKLVVAKGKMRGVYFGRDAIKTRGPFNVQTASSAMDSVSVKQLRILQGNDGFGYHMHPHYSPSALPPRPKRQDANTDGLTELDRGD
jgi:hypothetical protein